MLTTPTPALPQLTATSKETAVMAKKEAQDGAEQGMSEDLFCADDLSPFKYNNHFVHTLQGQLAAVG